MPNPVDQYRTTQIRTSSPGEIVVLLYDAAIRCLSGAELALEQGSLDLASARLIWTQKIMIELMSAVDEERGGALGQEIVRLHAYFYEALCTANVTKDVELIRSVKGMLDQLRAAWRRANVVPASGARTDPGAGAAR